MLSPGLALSPPIKFSGDPAAPGLWPHSSLFLDKISGMKLGLSNYLMFH